MRPVHALLIAIAAGAWTLLAPAPAPVGSPPPAPLEDRWDLGWLRGSEARRAGSGAEGRVLVYVRADQGPCLTLERAAGADEVLARAAAPFEAVCLEPEARAEDARIAAALGVRTAPRMLVLEAAAWLQVVNGAASAADLPVRPVRAVTGGRLEPIGVAWELERILAEPASAWWCRGAVPTDADPVLAVETLEAAGALAVAEALLAEGLLAERSPNGIHHRMARLRAAIDGHTVQRPADSEGSIEAALLRERDPRLLFRGWSLLASVLERRALAAAAATDGTHLGVDAGRWHRRVRETSRLAWVDCPDEVALPFGALVVERYGARPEDLDSLDRAFCGAVLQSLRRMAGGEHPRVRRAAEVVQGLR